MRSGAGHAPAPERVPAAPHRWLSPGIERRLRLLALMGALEGRGVSAVDRFLQERDLAFHTRLLQRLRGPSFDIVDPRRHTERVANSMVFCRDPRLRRNTDKARVRDHVAAAVGPQVLPPLIGVYSRAGDIPWRDLPDAFVARCSHGSGLNVIVTDKRTADRDAVLARLDGFLARNWRLAQHEWAYGGYPRRIVVESYLGDPAGGLPVDYKFFMFGGRFRLLRMFLSRGQSTKTTCTYDENLRWTDLRMTPGERTAEVPLPPNIADMIAISRVLAEDFPFVRVDLYNIGGAIRFGELTHYCGAAKDVTEPGWWDDLMGGWWTGKPFGRIGT